MTHDAPNRKPFCCRQQHGVLTPKFCDVLRRRVSRVDGNSTGYALNGVRQTTIAYDTYGRISTMTIPTTENGENVHSPTPTQNSNSYIWDCSENVATRPLVWLRADSAAYYVHDGNKNVSEVISSSGDLAAHYDYAPFGAVIAQRGVLAVANPWRFSSGWGKLGIECITGDWFPDNSK